MITGNNLVQQGTFITNKCPVRTAECLYIRKYTIG